MVDAVWEYTVSESLILDTEENLDQIILEYKMTVFTFLTCKLNHGLEILLPP